MAATTGLNRLFGQTTQGRIQELRRQALVAQSEITEDAAADGTFPRLVTLIRRQQTVAGSSALGTIGTWVTLTAVGLVAHVRTAGVWKDKGTPTPVVLNESQRVVFVADVPALGAAGAGLLLVTDRFSWDDPVRGPQVWDVTEVRDRTPDGLCVALCELAREEGV